MGVKVKSMVVCPECLYRQKGEKRICGKYSRSLNGTKRDWWLFIDHAGKKKAKKIGTKAAADEVARKVEARITLGDIGIMEGNSKMPTLEEYSERWLKYVQSVRRDSTHERYEYVMQRQVLPVFGTNPIDTVKRSDVRDFLVGLLNEGVARSTVRLVRNIFSGLYAHALEEELVAANPVTGVAKRLNLEKDKAEIDVLTKQESALFLDTCQGDYPEHYPFFLCASRTGLRLGELLALHWGDIDWNSNFIVVQRTYRRGVFGLPKSGKARRVDMSDQLVACLKGLYRAKQKESLATGKGAVDGLIFCRKDGNPLEQNYMRRIFKRALKKAGLRELRVHDLRHSYASQLLSQGESAVYVRDQMGHHSISITVDIYGRWIRSGNREAVNKLDTIPNETHTKPAQEKATQPVKIAPLYS